MTPFPGSLHPSGASGHGGVGGMGRKGEEKGRWEKGRDLQGEVDQPQAQCLPRISKNVPLEQSHTRHGKNQCAPSHTHASHLHPLAVHAVAG